MAIMTTTDCHLVRLCTTLLPALFPLLASSPDQATDSTPAILVHGATIVDAEHREADVVVNILVTKGKLDIVTRDEIRVTKEMDAYDASGGFVLGSLGIGAPASFLILSEDPRDNTEALLDTKAYAQFAIQNGNILLNNLPLLTDTAPPTIKGRKRRWLAYTPPPTALPLSYRNATKWNHWETKYISGLFTGALLLDRIRRGAENGQQMGSLSDFDGGDIRGLRFGAIGTLNFANPWVYTFFIATNAYERGFNAARDDDLILFDYRLDIPTPLSTTLSIGKQKEPISLERLMQLPFLAMQERSAVSDAMFPSRNVGIVLSGTGFGERMTWAGGLFNDWFDAGQPLNESGNQVAGRLTTLALVSEDESSLLHIGAGVRYSDAKEGIRYASEPEFHASPLFVDTGDLTASGAWTFNVESWWRQGAFMVGGEYVGSAVAASASGNPWFDGYNINLVWAITEEERRYSRRNGTFSPLPISRSVYQNGWGAWEATTRWSSVDLTDGTVDGGQMRIFSLGATWWLAPFFNVSANYRHIILDRFGTTGHSDGINLRLGLLLD